MRTLLTEQDVNTVVEEKGYVIYARGNSQESVEMQVQYCKEFAESRGIEVAEVVVDINSKNGLKGIIKGVIHNEYDSVLVYNLSRITRDNYEAIEFLTLMNFHDVGLFEVGAG